MSSKKEVLIPTLQTSPGRPTRANVIAVASAIMQSQGDRLHDLMLNHGTLGVLGPALRHGPRRELE